MSNITEARNALHDTLVFWIPAMERKTLLSSLHGEEGSAIADTVLGVLKTINEMPVIYSQSEVEDPTVYLHYFKGGMDFWITEKDVEGSTDQAFGFACLGDPQNAELGYISISELTINGVELDLYWTPKLLSEVKARLGV